MDPGMAAGLTVGSAVTRVGRLSYGTIEALELPSGVRERIPVIIAAGRHDGPTVWLTANIHGPELTGIGVIHRVVTEELCARLRGTVVAIPTLNPTGLQLGTRQPAYQRADPNRLFPLPPREPEAGEEPDEGDPPSAYETLATTIFEQMQGKVDYLLDLHNASLGSIPFVIRDRLLYRDEAELPAIEALQARLGAFADSIGITNLNEFKGKKYVSDKLHRSVAGVALNYLRVPALTLELGGGYILDPVMVEVGVVGVRNALRAAGLLEGDFEPVTEVPVLRAPYPLRREPGLRAPETGLFEFRVRPGTYLEAGEVAADLRDLYGRPVGEGVVRAEQPCWIVGQREGILAFRGTPLATLAVRDDDPLIRRE